jgi:hypothetical protein
VVQSAPSVSGWAVCSIAQIKKMKIRAFREVQEFLALFLNQAKG